METRGKAPDAEIAPAEMYHRLFVDHREGATVLEDLCARFHDRTIYVPGGIEAQRETEKRAAQKEVIGFILRRIGTIGDNHNAE